MTIHIEIDDEILEKAKAVLATHGLSVERFIQMLFEEVARNEGWVVEFLADLK